MIVTRVVAATLACVLVCLGSASAQERVDLELVLLADASRSIDEAEIELQRRGYAAAITHPEVLSAIANGFSGKIAVTYVEWGDETSQEIVAPWTLVSDQASAEAFAAVLFKEPRRASGMNAIGSAISFAQNQIESNSIDGFRKVIDFSADSAYSWGGVPIEEARVAALSAEIVINGLAILCRDPDCNGRPIGYDLESAFADQIIGGPGSFVVTADSSARFADAVLRKMLLEIAGTGLQKQARR